MTFAKLDVDALLAAWRAAFPEPELSKERLPLDETVVTFSPEDVIPAARILVEQFDVTHLSTITGDDTGEGVALLYHFWAGGGITLRTLLPYDALRVPTLTDLIPGAAFYEREIWEMLGVAFEGHPDPQPLLMPDDWQGEHRMRRSEDEENQES
jgi:NADH:ubiquinone oxidoreductase subunit C